MENGNGTHWRLKARCVSTASLIHQNRSGLHSSWKGFMEKVRFELTFVGGATLAELTKSSRHGMKCMRTEMVSHILETVEL